MPRLSKVSDLSVKRVDANLFCENPQNGSFRIKRNICPRNWITDILLGRRAVHYAVDNVVEEFAYEGVGFHRVGFGTYGVRCVLQMCECTALLGF